MKPVKLVVLCSVLAMSGCGDKNEADTAKNGAPAPTSLEQGQDVASNAVDTAKQAASEAGAAVGSAAESAQEGAAAVAEGAEAGMNAATDAATAGAAAVDETVTAAEGVAGATAEAVAPAPDAAAPAAGTDLALGESIYTGKCQACHATGAAGSPKLDDKANWAPRIAQGMDTLVKHALEGFKGSVGFMPPKGGFATLTDDEVKAAVAYMVSKSQ